MLIQDSSGSSNNNKVIRAPELSPTSFLSPLSARAERVFSAPMLSEQEYGFSRAPGGKLFLAGLLGIANIIGVWTLSTLPANVLSQAMRGGGLPGFTIALLPVLQVLTSHVWGSKHEMKIFGSYYFGGMTGLCHIIFRNTVD